MTVDVNALQRRLGVTVDGQIGRGTLAALFCFAGASPERGQELALSAAIHFPAYGLLNSDLRLAHFMAQLGHESGGFRYMEEIADGSAYEGRASLGNSQPGDGKRFKGRGPIQITGRANYRNFGRRIGVDVERHPEIAAVPSIGLHLACEYWKSRDLNLKADANDVEGITRAINGGLNGFEDRKARLAKMKGLLA